MDWQLSNLPKANWRFIEGSEEREGWETFRQRYQSLGPVVVRAVGAPATVAEILEIYNPTTWIAHALNGIVLMSLSNADVVPRMRERMPVIIEKAPLEMRRRVPTFGVAPPELRVMKELKKAYDPSGRLNPGRHIDGE